MKQNILIIGSGGREHALGWKLSESQSVSMVYYCPGNGGTINNLSFSITDFSKIKSFAKKNNCIVVVGPEEPLTKGIVNELSESIPVFGPTKEAAQLESSKSFAKLFMKENNIPTAKYASFSDPEKAKDYVYKTNRSLVIKADGLAAGKGVVVCDSKEDALNAIDSIMIRKRFGNSGNVLVIEERLYGEEVSFIGISDGNTIVPMVTAQDYKRIYDDDNGPNTGGMGSFSPSRIISNDLFSAILNKIMNKTIQAMKKNSNPFRGFLYAGLMIEKDTQKIHVLEYNVRMGDPECQSIMVRMNSDLLDYIKGSIYGTLDTLAPIRWSENSAICIVMAERGYPINYKTGNVIHGLTSSFGHNIKIFHAGTKRDNNNNKKILTSGGRVLGVTAIGRDFGKARSSAYDAVKKIYWGKANQYYRKDIGLKVI
ncbi:MAG TPA: phosphoribosylamine--glycine ligase [Nitrososphaeraceae archaeon]|nr:phosphoribosylamine--glycine ligase [Nitrososphaeraceae archaeon]